MLRLTHTPALRPAPAGSGESRWRGALAVASAPQGACPLPVHGLTCAARSHRPLLRHRHGRPRNSSGPGGPLFSSSSSSLYGHSSQLPFNDCISDKKHEKGAQPLKVSPCMLSVPAAFRSLLCQFPASRAVHARRSGYGRRSGLVTRKLTDDGFAHDRRVCDRRRPQRWQRPSSWRGRRSQCSSGGSGRPW